MDLVALVTQRLRTTAGPAEAPDVRGPAIEQIASECLGEVERLTRRRLNVVDNVEWLDGNGRRTLYLANDPIQQLTSVTIGGTTVDLSVDPAKPWKASAIAVSNDRQAIEWTQDGMVFSTGRRNVYVSYKAGFDYDVQREAAGLVGAVVEWAAARFLNRYHVGQTTAAAQGVVTQTYDHRIPDYVKRAIDAHARWTPSAAVGAIGC